MMFNKTANKETVKILLQENKRLKCENQRLRESIEGLQRYKDEYKGLVEELSHLKESYMEKMAEFKRIGEEYKKELDRVKTTAGKA